MSEEKKPYGRAHRPEDERPHPAGSARWLTRKGYIDYCSVGKAPDESCWEEAIHHELVRQAMATAWRCCGGESLFGLHLYAFPSKVPEKPGYDVWVLGRCRVPTAKPRFRASSHYE